MDRILGKALDESRCGLYVGDTKTIDHVFNDDALILVESLSRLPKDSYN